MTVLSDPLVHIHQVAGDPCIACGDADDGTLVFTSDPGYWNRLNDRCSPSKQVNPSFQLLVRDDPRTSALLGERKPNPKRGARDE